MKKGQALVEFIIIFPILIFLILIMIDFGLIIYKKNVLENYLNEAILIYKENRDENESNEYIEKIDEDILYEWEKDGEYKRLTLVLDYQVLTPGLNLFFDNNLEIKANRVIYDE